MLSIREELLGLLTEDDYDLAEVTVQVQAPRADLRAAIGALLDEGLVQWVFPVDDPGETVSVANSQTRLPDLDDARAWSLPPGGSAPPTLRVTQAGWSAYFGRPPDPDDWRW